MADVSRSYPNGLDLTVGPQQCRLNSKEIEEFLGVAEALPIIQAVREAPDGGLWVERFSLPDEDPAIDRFDRDLRYLGTYPAVGRLAGFLSERRVVVLRWAPLAGAYLVAIVELPPTR